MTNQEIIQKFNLKKTDIQHGEGFRNNQTIYLWPNLAKGYKSYLILGESGDDSCLLISTNDDGFKTEVVVSHDMLDDNPKDMMMRILGLVISYNRAGH